MLMKKLWSIEFLLICFIVQFVSSTHAAELTQKEMSGDKSCSDHRQYSPLATFVSTPDKKQESLNDRTDEYNESFSRRPSACQRVSSFALALFNRLDS